MKRAILFAAFVAMSLAAQVRISRPPPPPPPPQQEQTGKASIDGTVVDAMTREPVRKATVMLNGNVGLGAVTDASGHFAFRRLPAGRYMIQAQSAKFPAPRQSVDAGQQVSITLAADEQKQDVVLALIPGASIRGHIVDDEGIPMRCSIQTMRLRDTDTGKMMETTASAQSDDQGEYRISTLAAGKYYVLAHCFQTLVLPHPLIRRNSGMDVPMLSYAPQFYPGVPSQTGAARIETLPNANIAGIDFRMTPGTGVTVRGHAGPLPPNSNVQITLEPKDPLRGQWERQGARFNPSTGEFQIPNVRPGSYEIFAGGSSEGHSYFARVPLEVGAARLEPLEIAIAEAPAISGTIAIEGDTKTPPNAPANPLRVMMFPLSGRPMMGQSPQAEVQSDGTFTLNAVTPGRWRLEVSGAPGYLKSVRSGDQDVSASNLEIGPSQAPLKIVISSKFAQVDATVSVPPSSTEQYSAILLPDSGNSSNFQNIIQNTIIGPNTPGRMMFSVPPGKYYACLVAMAQPWVLMQNRPLRKALESLCEAVDVPETGSASVKMPVVSAQDLKRLAEKLEE